MFLEPGLNVILDGQWGSTGKGKLSGFIGKRDKPDLVCSSFGPNAGHTYVDDDGTKSVLRCISTAAIAHPDAMALILPDSVINEETFYKEVGDNNLQGRVKVHPRVAVVVPEDEQAAKLTGRHLAGTMKGTGHAISRKILRIKGTRLAGDILPSDYLDDTTDIIHDTINAGKIVLAEMSQGFDLSVNHGHDYPYLTSRDITTGAALNACGCPHSVLRNVIGSIRTFPIRVGNVEGGWSGPHHSDHHEITWAQITEDSNSGIKVEERTTVTNRVRRVFTFSLRQVARFVKVNDPTCLFLNFVQYLNASNAGVKEIGGLTNSVKHMASAIENHTGVPVMMLGTGAKDGEMVVKNGEWV